MEQGYFEKRRNSLPGAGFANRNWADCNRFGLLWRMGAILLRVLLGPWDLDSHRHYPPANWFDQSSGPSDRGDLSLAAPHKPTDKRDLEASVEEGESDSTHHTINAGSQAPTLADRDLHLFCFDM